MIEAIRKNTPVCQLDVSIAPGGLQQTLTVEGAAASALRPVETLDFDEGRVGELAATLYGSLNQLAAQRRPGGGWLEELARTGQALGEKVLAPQIRERLKQAGGGHLTLLLDEALIGIPWELLHDGERFLCERFAPGRIVRTSQGAPEAPPAPETCRQMLILANPTGDLPGAAAELETLRATVRSLGGEIRILASAHGVSRAFLSENLPVADVVHYSGHVQFDAAAPERSGLLLSDGVYTAAEVRQLTQAGRRMPGLVFVNGCGSGRGDAQARQLSIFNLSNAFLLGGVRHFIGTAADVPDELAAELATHCYRFLLQGASAGTALAQARAAAGKARPELASGALSYILYGDPCRSPLIGAGGREEEAAAPPGAARATPRCAACGREILSRLSGGRQGCEVCGLPICQPCWAGRGVRRCPQHPAAGQKTTTPAPAANRAPAAAPASAGRTPARCGQCERVITQEPAEHRCGEEGCGQAICERCWRQMDRRTCQAHTRSWGERVGQARALLEEGRMALLLDRETARQRETFYYREIRERLAGNPVLTVGRERFALAAGSLAEGTALKELEGLLARVSDGGAIAERCPRNPRLEVQFQQYGFLGPRQTIGLRLEIVSDLERQVFPGYESAPQGARPILERIAQGVHPTREAGFQLVDVLASTSGWNEEARRLAGGAAASELRQESGHIMVLVDLETDELIHAPAFPLPAELLELVRPSSRVNTATELESHIRQTLTVGEFLTEAELAEQFRAQPRQVRAVFQTLERTGDYEVREIRPVGLAITKRYAK